MQRRTSQKVPNDVSNLPIACDSGTTAGVGAFAVELARNLNFKCTPDRYINFIEISQYVP